jgi:TRAP-type mannitol/chloroaromatic compound transport system permease small subunit
MSTFLKGYIKFVGWLNDRVGAIVSWLTAALVILVCGDVIIRYLLKDTAAWIMELEWHLFALTFIFGAAYTFKHDKHVRVDLFYDEFSERDKALVNLVGGLVLLIPWCTLLIWFSWQFAWQSYLIRETSPNPGGLPALYLIKFSIPIGMSLLLLQALASVASSILVLRKRR